MEMTSQTEKENTHTHTLTTSTHSRVACQQFRVVFQNSTPSDVISEASHPERILVVFLVPKVDVRMAGQMHIRPRLLPY